MYFDEIIEIEEFFLGRQGDAWQLYNADATPLLDHVWNAGDFGFFTGYPFNGFGESDTAVVQFGDAENPCEGIIDRSGRIVVEPKYNFLENFSCGLARCLQNGKFGYVDLSGTERISPIYESALSFSENLAAVMIGKKWGYIDIDGNMVIPAQYDDAESFCGGTAAVLVNDLYGLIDTGGKTVIPATCAMIGMPYDGLRIAQAKDGLYGMLDVSGNVILPPEYESVIRTDDGTYITVRSGEESYFTGENGRLIPLTRVDAVLTD